MAFNFFSGLFSKKNEPGIDFSSVRTDMHSHLIPGIDDGSKSVEESVALIKRFYELGFRKLITTPHIMSDYYRNTPAIINEGLEKVKEAIKKENIDIELSAAAEYYLDDGFVHKLENEKLLTFGDNYLLFEVSYINCPDNLKDILFRMQVLGYKPVLAHPERYPFWSHRFKDYFDFKDQGILLQININSLGGYYGMDAKKTAQKLIDNNMVDLIGSDLHGINHADAMKKTMREKYFRKVIEMDLINKRL